MRAQVQQQQQQQQQQAQMQPQARPPWLPQPVIMMPPFRPLSAAPAHLHMPLPGMPGFAPPGFGPPQGWPGHGGAPPSWQGAYPQQGRSMPGQGPQRKEGGGQGG